MSASRYVRVVVVATALVGAVTWTGLQLRADYGEGSAPAGLRGVVLTEAHVGGRLDPQQGRSSPLRAGELLTVLAESTVPRSLAPGEPAARDLLVRAGDGRHGWVHGSAVAVEVREPYRRTTLGWPSDPPAIDLDGDRRLDDLWFATREEWDEGFPSTAGNPPASTVSPPRELRPWTHGTLVVDVSEGRRVLALGYDGPWGSAESIVGTWAKDLGADGTAELLVLLATHVAEGVGYAGLHLAVIGWEDGPRELLRVGVGDPRDPHGVGEGGPLPQDRFGWVTVGADALVHVEMELAPCELGSCLTRVETRSRPGEPDAPARGAVLGSVGGAEVALVAMRGDWAELATRDPAGEVRWHPRAEVRFTDARFGLVADRVDTTWRDWVEVE